MDPKKLPPPVSAAAPLPAPVKVAPLVAANTAPITVPPKVAAPVAAPPQKVPIVATAAPPVSPAIIGKTIATKTPASPVKETTPTDNSRVGGDHVFMDPAVAEVHPSSQQQSGDAGAIGASKANEWKQGSQTAAARIQSAQASTVAPPTTTSGAVNPAPQSATSVPQAAAPASTGASPSVAVPAVVKLDRTQVLKMLEMSYRNLPHPSDCEKAKPYMPPNPYRTMAFYPQSPHPIFNSPDVFSKFEADTLFFIFYYQQATYQQYLAAVELKKQSWRYHKKYLTWFQRHEKPKNATEDFEIGNYLYFDYESGWSQRVKQEFTFKYSYLEDELIVS